jgi:hypothetical protein
MIKSFVILFKIMFIFIRNFVTSFYYEPLLKKQI